MLRATHMHALLSARPAPRPSPLGTFEMVLDALGRPQLMCCFCLFPLSGPARAAALKDFEVLSGS